MKKEKNYLADVISFSQSCDHVPGITIYKEERLILPHFFRDVSGGNIGGGRREKKGGRGVNKKDKTRLDPRMDKAERGRKEANKNGGRGQEQNTTKVWPLKFPASVKMGPPVGGLSFYTLSLSEIFYVQILRLIFLLKHFLNVHF